MPAPPMKLCYVCEATQGGVRKHLRDLLHEVLKPEEGFEVFGIFGDRGEAGGQGVRRGGRVGRAGISGGRGLQGVAEGGRACRHLVGSDGLFPAFGARRHVLRGGVRGAARKGSSRSGVGAGTGAGG